MSSIGSLDIEIFDPNGNWVAGVYSADLTKQAKKISFDVAWK